MNGATITNGTVKFNGVDSYVNLPCCLLNGLRSLTVEFWATFGINGDWARVYDFGDQDATGLNGRSYIFFTPHSGTNVDFRTRDYRMVISDSAADYGWADEDRLLVPGTLDGRTNVCVACVYDTPNDTMSLYVNGTLQGTAQCTMPLADVRNVFSYLGRSLYAGEGDAYLNGSIDEFRMYKCALTSQQIAASYAAGPDASLPSWTGSDVGTPGAPGSFSYSNGTYTVSGSGEGTDGSADVFYFLHQTLSGNSQIIARLKSLQGGDPNLAEAGIMIRQSLDPGSSQVSLSVNAGTDMIFRRRLAANAIGIENSFSETNYFHGTNYLWLRLMRMGKTFIAYDSTNGVNWQYVWFTTLSMSNQVQVGLEVTAHHYGELATASFDNVSIGSLTPLSGTWPLPGPKLLTGGQNWSPAEFQRVGGFEFLLTGIVGDYFSINGSSNLTIPFASWPSLGTVTNTYGVVPFLDVQAPTNNIHYYRAQRLGP